MVVEELLDKINAMLQSGEITMRSTVEVNALFGYRSYDIEAYKADMQQGWITSERILNNNKQIKSSLIIDTLL